MTPPEGLLVDRHAHWMPPALLALLERRSAYPRIERTAEGAWLIGRGRSRLLGPAATDLARRREALADCGIGRQELSLSSLWNIDNLPGAEALPLVRAFNDAVAGAAWAGAGTFGGVAAVPVADMKLACGELERAALLGLGGVILPADAFSSVARTAAIRPLLESANALGMHVFVHPGWLERPAPAAAGVPIDNAWQRHIVLGAQQQLSEAMVTLCASPLLRRYPRLSVQIANLGGNMPWLLDRWASVVRDDPEPGKQPPWCMDAVTVDTASFGAASIGWAHRVFGAGKLVLGTDAPVFCAAQSAEAWREAGRSF